jgi:dTDP-glucose 4,6-dehydratase
MRPSNPYSATKASADMLVMAWHRTFGIPYLILRPSNNYGKGQYVEKFIPKSCKYLYLGKKVPLHENGTPVRTWLHASDTADAVLHLIDSGAVNDIYNISGNYEDTNLNVFKKILAAMGMDPNDYEKHVEFFQRPGQDVRYSIDDTKLRKLGWTNRKNFDDEISRIVSHHSGRFTW